MIGDIGNCENCGKPFEIKRKRHRFCDPRCRFEFWARTHPRVQIGIGFKIVPNEPGGNRNSARERA
jgi:hypothetical protein